MGEPLFNRVANTSGSRDSRIAKKVLKRYDDLLAKQSNWRDTWEEVLRYNFPNNNFVFDSTVGSKKGQDLFNTTSADAAEEVSAALHSLMTPPTTKWFGMSTGDRELDRDKDVSEFMEMSVSKMLSVINNSNFHTVAHVNYLDMTVLGTAVLRMEEDDKDVIQFHSKSVYKVVLDIDSKERVDTVGRSFKYTLRQIVQEYGNSVLTEDLKRRLAADMDEKLEIIHLISPDTTKSGGNNGRFTSYHVLRDTEILLRESSYRDFPYAVPRFSKMSEEVYGRGPSIKKLPDTKALNQLEKVTIKAAQLNIAPPFKVSQNGLVRSPNLKPFGMNVVKSNAVFEPLLNGARVDIGNDQIMRKEESINRGYMLNQFRIAESDRMTATEVMQRRDEQFRGLNSLTARINDEYLKPIVNFVFNTMLRRGMFGELPEKLAGIAKLNIRYLSLIAKAQEQGEAENLGRAINVAAPILQAQPQALDYIDGDEVIKGEFARFGVDPRYLKSDDSVKQKREQDAQQQQALLEAQTNKEESETVKNLSDAGATATQAEAQ